MRYLLLNFVVVAILMSTGCSLVVDSSDQQVVEISMGGSRALLSASELPFYAGDELILAVTSVNGLNQFAEKVYNAPSDRYRLSVNLERGKLYRATALYRDGNAAAKGFDTKLFVAGGEQPILNLHLGHVPKIKLARPNNDTDIIVFTNEVFSYSGLDDQSDPGCKIKFIVTPPHTSTLTQYEYRLNKVLWISQNAADEPILTFNMGLNIVEVRYRQESDGNWVGYTFNITRNY